ncbi:MAG: hypothetical protein DU429_01950 [Candidatus Tokpelaia sp.]|nr:MAG: hypothetical protein DU430_03665 [Candidatus Tokpelaia sp.]KAA6207271.1 MAG: hypothetical protein DU429_01950 [Candidatus Tokpelaia sp.]
MELSELKAKICNSFTGSQTELDRILALVEQDKAVFPFNEYEHLICNLIEAKGLGFAQYMDIRSEYIAANPYLWIFEIAAPRGFGEKFAQTYVLGKCSALKPASKRLDSDFSGQYDLWLDGIKIEVKASRAVDNAGEGPLYVRALSRNTKQGFLMNFQQLKPQCCDVFIWVAVFRDEIVLWVMSSKEVHNNPLYSKGQHRGNSGNEGQLHVKHDNIALFDKFELKNDNLEQAVRDAFARNQQNI